MPADRPDLDEARAWRHDFDDFEALDRVEAVARGPATWSVRFGAFVRVLGWRWLLAGPWLVSAAVLVGWLVTDAARFLVGQPVPDWPSGLAGPLAAGVVMLVVWGLLVGVLMWLRRELVSASARHPAARAQ